MQNVTPIYLYNDFFKLKDELALKVYICLLIEDRLLYSLSLTHSSHIFPYVCFFTVRQKMNIVWPSGYTFSLEALNSCVHICEAFRSHDFN